MYIKSICVLVVFFLASLSMSREWVRFPESLLVFYFPSVPNEHVRTSFSKDDASNSADASSWVRLGLQAVSLIYSVVKD